MGCIISVSLGRLDPATGDKPAVSQRSAALKRAKKLLLQGFMDVGICTPRRQVVLSDEFDQLEGTRPAMNSRPFKTAYELQDMIVEQSKALHGPWPAGMTLFVFDDAYGWTASISRPVSEGDNFYRTCTLDLITRLRARYDLDASRLSEPGDTLFASSSNPRRSTWPKASKEAIGKSRNLKKRRSR